MTQFIEQGGGGGGGGVDMLSVARKFLLNKLAYYQAIEKHGTERTEQMCMLICLIVVRKHGKNLRIHCSDNALKRLHRS